MQNDGKLVFGVLNGSTQVKITTAKAYNNGQWHHVVGTQSSAGMRLYVDGQPVGANPQSHRRRPTRATGGSPVTPLGARPAASSAARSTRPRSIPTALSAARVAQHFAAGGGVVTNQPPTAAFTSSKTFLAASFDGSGSTDADGSIAVLRLELR